MYRLREALALKQRLLDIEAEREQERELVEREMELLRRELALAERELELQKQTTALREQERDLYREQMEEWKSLFEESQRKGGGFGCKLKRIITLGLARPCI